MTALGKILVFFVLIFSVVIGALVVMDYTARTHWAKGVQDRDNLIKVLRASNEAYQNARQKAEEDAAKAEAAANYRVKLAEDARDRAGEEITKLNDRLNALSKTSAGHEAVASAAQEETKLRQDEVKQLRDQIKTLDNDNIRRVSEANKANASRVAAEIERDAFKQRNTQMLAQLQTMAKDLEKARASGASGATPAVARGKNPPKETVEGLVRTVGGDGLMTVTIGSDSGVQKNNTLEVFRLNPPKYLGTIRVLSVTPKEAVAQPLGRLLGEVQQGDVVSNRIVGN